jgi:hypothetical protein
MSLRHFGHTCDLSNVIELGLAVCTHASRLSELGVAVCTHATDSGKRAVCDVAQWFGFI